MTTKPFLALFAALVSLGAAAPSAPAQTPAAGHEVHISNFRFGPQQLTVVAGTNVTFVNDDEEPHNITAADHGYRSPILNTGARWSHVYATPGDYSYFCALHPHMTAHILVVRR